MTGINAKIITLLNKGWSYSQIQDELQVSSKTIAAAKKAHFPITESSIDVLSGDTFQINPQPPPTAEENIIKQNHNKPIKQRTIKMSTDSEYYNEDDEITSKLELEKYRLTLSHELEMEKIQVASQEREREYKLREMEIEHGKKKAEEEKRELLFKIKKIIDACEDAEYNYEEAETLLENTRKVLYESEKYCFINQITFQGSVSHTLLAKVINSLTDFMDGMDEDESGNLEFDNTFRRLVNRTTFQSF